MQIQHGGEVGIESKGANFFANQSPMLAEHLLGSGSSDIGDRGRWSDGVAQAVDRAAFHVDAEEQRCFAGLLCLAQKSVGLFGMLDIALEENDTAGAQPVEHDS